MDKPVSTSAAIENAMMKKGTKALPPHIREHLPLASEAAERNLHRLEATKGAALNGIHHQLKSVGGASTPKAQRMMRVRHIAGQWSELVATEAACRKGCSHCCHLSTTVPRQEAELMAKATGAQMNKAPRTYSVMADESERPDYFGVPCPFLKQGACSIYAHRPVACRTLLNLADDDTLCQLLPGVDVPVPYANGQMLQGTFVALALDQDWADIRDWFHAGGLPSAQAASGE